jgi:phosphatase NudJ
MARHPIPTWYFALVIVRLGHRFLLVQEAKHGQLWYLPAGRVEPGENLINGAKRETLEETGISVAIDSIVRVEHSPTSDGTARLRVVFVAHPQDDTPPKNTPDEHSLRSGWFTLAEMAQLPLRGQEVVEMCQYVDRGGIVYPTSLITFEGAKFS